jgi:hypothetical protein
MQPRTTCTTLVKPPLTTSSCAAMSERLAAPNSPKMGAGMLGARICTAKATHRIASAPGQRQARDAAWRHAPCAPMPSPAFPPRSR